MIRAVVLLVAALVAPVVATAASLTQVVVLGPPQIEDSPRDCGQTSATTYECQEEVDWWNGNLGLPGGGGLPFDQFDPALGTLLGVTFETAISADFRTEYGPLDYPGDPSFELGTTSAGVYIRTFLGSRYRSEGEIVGEAISEELDRTNCIAATYGGLCFLEWSLYDDDERVLLTELERFVGTETFPVWYDGGFWVASGWNYEYVEGGWTNVGRLEVAVTYTYLPEPRTGLLMALGMLGIAVGPSRSRAG